MMSKDKYILPIGTVVSLQEGDVFLMIVGRAQLFNQDGVIGYFDYSATLYPQGLDGNQEFIFFNKEDVKEVIFEGFRNDQEIDFAENYEKNIEATDYPKLSIKS